MTARKRPASSDPVTHRLAFSYQRVSSGKQATEGRTGIERQSESFLPFCEVHGLTANADPLVDKGVSAFKGRHREDGALGAFIKAAEQGTVPSGSVLVVEDIDRFSREAPSRAEELLLRLFELEIALGIVRDDVIVDREKYDTDIGVRVMLLTRRDAANDYSKKLSARTTKVWEKRRQDWEKKGKRFLGKAHRPYWLGDDGTDFTVIQEHASAVRLIFEMVANKNMGGTQIAVQLKKLGISTATGKTWHASRINRVLADRRVLGEKEWNDETISVGYFPRIIEQGLWDQARAAVDRHSSNKGKLGRGEKIHLLFQGACVCRCGSGIRVQPSRDRKGEVKYWYLHCMARLKHECPLPPGLLRYDEEALLQAFMDQRWELFFNRQNDTKERQALSAKVRELESVQAKHLEEAKIAKKNLNQLMVQADLNQEQLRLITEVVTGAEQKAKDAEQEVLQVKAELQRLELEPTGPEIKRLIEAKVTAFLQCDRFDIERRRDFNNWLLSLGVQITVDGANKTVQWGTTSGYLYRDELGDVVLDERAADLKALGASPEVVAEFEMLGRQAVGKR